MIKHRRKGGGRKGTSIYEATNDISVSEIISKTCATLCLKECNVVSTCPGYKKPESCDARHIIALLIREIHQSNYSYRAIAIKLGKRLKNGKGDHASASYSEWIAKELLKSGDKKFTEKYNKVKEALNG